MEPEKLLKWHGKNKNLVRLRKYELGRLAYKTGRLPKNTRALTLAGAQAHLEKMLTSRGIFKPEDIVTVQRIDEGVDRRAFNSLLKVRDEDIPGMYIWPHTFESFCQGHKNGEVYTPPVQYANQPKWYQDPVPRQEMHKFHEIKFKPYSYLDIDLCGCFSKTHAQSVEDLFRSQALADRGLLFLNYQKGRERARDCSEYILDYLSASDYFDLDGYRDPDGDPIEIRDIIDKCPYTWTVVRYSVIPIIYSLMAFTHGYLLEVERLVEYRDASTRGVGVNMVQWFFRFRRLRSFGKTVISLDLYRKDRELLDLHIDRLAKWKFPHDDKLEP